MSPDSERRGDSLADPGFTVNPFRMEDSEEESIHTMSVHSNERNDLAGTLHSMMEQSPDAKLRKQPINCYNEAQIFNDLENIE